jgi:hypothetical protein
LLLEVDQEEHLLLVAVVVEAFFLLQVNRFLDYKMLQLELVAQVPVLV